MPRTKGIRQGLTQRLSKLEAQEQERREWLKDEQKKLAQLHAKRKAAQEQVDQQRWMAVGRLVEMVGLPTDDLDALKETLQLVTDEHSALSAFRDEPNGAQDGSFSGSSFRAEGRVR